MLLLDPIYLLLFISITTFLLLILVKSIYVVQQSEAIIIERLGKYKKILHPGIHIVIPFAESPRDVTWSFFKENDGKRYYRFYRTFNRIDLREAVYDFPKQNVITKDNVTMEISALLYYQITDPHAAVYAISNLPEAIEKLTHSTLRNVIGSMDLDESLISRDQINGRLRMILDEASDKWGVKVNRVELQEVNPPESIRKAMEQQMRAERDRRAIILEAEGAKQAAILKAEGEQQAQIANAHGQSESATLRAQGEANARLCTAQAEATALEMLSKALPEGTALQYSIALQYLKTLPQITEGHDNKLIVVPYEASAMMGSLSGIKKILENIQQ